jgi:hypothetical protein
MKGEGGVRRGCAFQFAEARFGGGKLHRHPVVYCRIFECQGLDNIKNSCETASVYIFSAQKN